MSRLTSFLPISFLALLIVPARVFGDEKPPAPKPADTVATEVKEFDISIQARNSVLVIKRNDGGQGTGFIVKRNVADKERFFVYTNQHVIAGCRVVPRVFRADGSTVTLGKLVTAVNYDLAVFMLEDPEPNYLEIQSDVEKVVKVGEPIATPGNSGGESAITFKFGKLLAVGPEIVEIDAMIKGGNSGGPILLRDGRVIGIVSYFKEETVDDPRLVDADKAKIIRRFGYRVDNVQSWETPDWKRFVSQGERVAKVESTSKDLKKLIDSNFANWNGNETIGKIVGTFRKNLNSARSQREAFGDQSKVFTELKNITMTDLNSAAADPLLYWWWKHTLSDERDFRESLDKAFEEKAAESRQKQ